MGGIMDNVATTAPTDGRYNLSSSLQDDFAEMETRMDERLAKVRALHLYKNKHDTLASTAFLSGRLD